MKVLELIDVVKTFDDGRDSRMILDQINFSIDAGELVAIVGPSGSGKSTLLQIAGALLTPDSGTVYINGQQATGLNEKERTALRLSEVGFIFQSSHLIPYLKTSEQIELVRKLGGLPEEKAIENNNLLKELNLSKVLDDYPETLSGGEKQRIAVARAFVNDPSIILADEPTASVDAQLGRQVVEMIRELTLKYNKAGLIVTHDDRVLDLMDKIYHLETGKLTYLQR